MRKLVLYAVIKLEVEVNDNTTDSDTLERIASECDYTVSYKDDVCAIVNTELHDVNTGV